MTWLGTGLVWCELEKGTRFWLSIWDGQRDMDWGMGVGKTYLTHSLDWLRISYCIVSYRITSHHHITLYIASPRIVLGIEN